MVREYRPDLMDAGEESNSAVEPTEPRYALIEADDSTKFVDEVNAAMAAGWKLHGSIVVTRTSEVTLCYVQAMVKE